MVVSKKDNLRCELRFGEVRSKKVKKVNSLGIVMTDYGKWDADVRQRLRIAK